MMVNLGRLVPLALLALAVPGHAQWQSLAGKPTVYHCPDGTKVEASYINTNEAFVTYMDRSARMTVAPSADGVRYIGGGWQWWTKGMTQGMIAPLKPGETIASAASQTCVVGKQGK